MLTIVKGNLLDSDCDFICHQVNCQGKMKSGIAKQIRERWPIVYHYYNRKYDATVRPISAKYNEQEKRLIASQRLLGDIQFVPLYDRFDTSTTRPQVINMFSQQDYGYDGSRYTSYDAFMCCLEQIARGVPKGSTIGFPYNIGCGLGGGNWYVISHMIEAVLGQDYEVRIYKLED